MKRSIFQLTVFLIILYALVPNSSIGEMITVTDMAGRVVTAPLDPDRIVCLGPGALRLIVYLQAESKVVAVEDMEKRNPTGRPYWMAHPELAGLPRCGPGGPASINKKPDLETLLSVNPQVIFITYMDAKLADEVQQILGIPLVVLTYGGFATFDESIYDALRIAGKVLHRQQRSNAVVRFIENLRKDMSVRTKDIPNASKPTVYVGGIGYRGAHGIESTEQRYIPFDWIGARNVADQLRPSIGTHVFVDKETLLKLNPEIIFIDGGGALLIAQDYHKKPNYYHALKAVSSRHVYTLLPFNWYATNIGTALADAYAIGRILYPSEFASVEPEQKADEIYAFLVGRPVYQKLKDQYGPIGGTAPFLNN